MRTRAATEGRPYTEYRSWRNDADSGGHGEPPLPSISFPAESCGIYDPDQVVVGAALRGRPGLHH